MEQPTIEVMGTAGITATFADGATVVMTVTGLFPCTGAACEAQCEHFHAALPYWNRHRWEMAVRNDNWGPRLLQGIGIVPPFIVRPDLVTSLSRWAPFGRGEEIAPSARVWHTVHGRLYRFGSQGLGNEGHIYVGADHPDGHTGCLICRGACDHVERALKLEAQICES